MRTPRIRGVSAIVVNYEGGARLMDCVASLGQETVAQTIVVDNGSRDGSTAAVTAEYPDVEVVAPRRNLGFAGGANYGAQLARAELLLFLNPDIRLGPGTVRALADAFGDRRVAVAGPPLYVAASDSVERGATIDVIGSPVPVERDAGHALYVPGCALMTRAAVFRELGGFDERFFLFVEDVDYCWRVLLRGYEVAVPSIEPVWHEGGAVATGGYISGGRLESTTFRVALRERNTLAMLLKCYGAPLAAVVAPLYALQSLATAGALAFGVACSVRARWVTSRSCAGCTADSGSSTYFGGLASRPSSTGLLRPTSAGERRGPERERLAVQP
jgi:GT2 family glycosyltransferase